VSIQVVWDNDDHTIVRYDYSPGWTWDEFREAGKTTFEMMASVNHIVHVIANFADRAFPPMGALGRFKSAQESMPKESVVVVVGGGAFINALVSTYTGLYRHHSSKLLVAKSLADAHTKIGHLRERDGLQK
jgi:broad specificity phosphatase PhoE